VLHTGPPQSRSVSRPLKILSLQSAVVGAAEGLLVGASAGPMVVRVGVEAFIT
jgi:hypothetical protein